MAFTYVGLKTLLHKRLITFPLSALRWDMQSGASTGDACRLCEGLGRRMDSARISNVRLLHRSVLCQKKSAVASEHQMGDAKFTAPCIDNTATTVMAQLLVEQEQEALSVGEASVRPENAEDNLNTASLEGSMGSESTVRDMNAADDEITGEPVEALNQLAHGLSLDYHISLLDLHQQVISNDGDEEPEDTAVTSSHVAPCPGCGAFLQTRDATLPGYVREEKLASAAARHRKPQSGVFCRRCSLMRQHQRALHASLPPETYVQCVSQIKGKEALVVLLLDLTDPDNSMLRRLPQLVGRKRPVYVVGNKVDLLPRDESGYLERVKAHLRRVCEAEGLYSQMYVKHEALISAKTGYGVEELVTKLMNDWSRKGDVYIMGCTNVGKSTLFNALLGSDYCRSQARDFIHRATTSVWPGTTLNLLKFPIVNPAPWRLYRRVQRLLKLRPARVEEERLRRQNLKETGNWKYAALHGHVGVTFPGVKASAAQDPTMDYAGVPGGSFSFDRQGASIKGAGATRDAVAKQFDAASGRREEESLTKSHWCFDTPGLINPAQVINLLEPEELVLMTSDAVIRPRTFILKPGQVLFVSGLGRLDYVKGPKSIYFTVLASRHLPVHVVDGPEADTFYRDTISDTTSFKVPRGDRERLTKIPSLIGREFNLTGCGWHKSVSDITLSSIGWVGVSAGEGMEVTLRAYTPGGQGCRLRTPSLLPYAVGLKGKRVRGTPRYKVRKPNFH